MEKRGQFFLLAAVIISAVVISLGATTNKASVNEEPGNFYDFSYEVKREAGAVLDYEVYTNFDVNVDLADFVELLAQDILERSPGSSFVFIYGNIDDMTVVSYGSESVYVDNVEIEGASEVSSRICIEDMCKDIDEESKSTGGHHVTLTYDVTRMGADDILIEIEGVEYIFPLTEYRQVIFVMRKDFGGDRYVSVK